MEKTVGHLVDYLIRTQTIEEDNKEIYAYGFQIGLEMIIAFTTIIVSAVIIGMPLECIMLLAVFFAIRGVTGGVHMDTFIACYLLSEVLMMLALAVIRYVKMELYVIAVISFLALVIIKCLSPVENNNRPVCDWEREVFRKRLNITIAILIVLESVLYITNSQYLLWIVTVGELLMVLSLTWGKVKYRKTR